MKPLFALVAQGIEHRIPNPGVACSIHAGGTIGKGFAVSDYQKPITTNHYILLFSFLYKNIRIRRAVYPAILNTRLRFK